VLVTGAASAYGTSASSFSQGTYANNAAITFTLQINSSNNLTVSHTPNSLGQNTWMNVAVFTSN
jgi:hypothetical protein